VVNQRIIYVESDNDPCHWQVQKRVWLFFWRNVNLSFSSITTAGNWLRKERIKDYDFTG